VLRQQNNGVVDCWEEESSYKKRRADRRQEFRLPKVQSNIQKFNKLPRPPQASAAHFKRLYRFSGFDPDRAWVARSHWFLAERSPI
jgi:hypothetical protein